MSLSNAQAALLATAQVYQGTAGDVSTQTMLGMAGHLKRGLDRLDAADREAKAAAKVPAPVRSIGFSGVQVQVPLPGPREAMFTDNVENSTTTPPQA